MYFNGRKLKPIDQYIYKGQKKMLILELKLGNVDMKYGYTNKQKHPDAKRDACLIYSSMIGKFM